METRPVFTFLSRYVPAMLAAAGALGLGLYAVWALSGCAIAPMGDGSGYAVGVRMSGAGASASEIGSSAGSVLSALGVPGGNGIGTLLGGVLAAAGIGVAAHKAGQSSGWDQRQAAAVPQPLPNPQAPTVAPTVQGTQA